MQFKMPELGEGVNEGELVTWKVQVGEAVKNDQVLCEVMTDKATIEIPSPFEGKVTSLNFKEGDMINVGDVIIEYEGGAGATASASPSPAAEKSAPTPAASAPAPSPAPAASTPTGGVQVAAAQTSPDTRVLAAPATRRLARERGVELGSVPGTGPNGRVMKEDVERFITGGSSMGATAGGGLSLPTSPVTYPSGGEKRVGFKGLRRKISEKMRESKDRAAHFTYVEEADVSELVRLRKHAKELGTKQGVKVTFLPFLMKAMVAALRQYPILNSSLDEESNELVYKYYYNISLSVQTDDGLMAPVIKNVEHKSILELARDIQGVVDRARSKRLTKEDFEGGTITLTNAGTIGGLFATPIINHPEVAILGFNKIFKKPVVRNINGADKIVIRDWTYFSISLDHRIVDGAIGAEFMNTFIKFVENPSLLLMETF